MIRTLATLALAGALVALAPAHAQGTPGTQGPQGTPSTQGASGIQNPWETGTDGLAPIPPLSARVTDRTNTLSASDREALETKLANYEAHTGTQIVVLIVPSTKPEPIEAYSIRVAEAWKIGRKGQDNGVVFLVAKDDRKMRLEVGYGLEGVLTDAMSRRIISDDVAPRFRDNQFAAGINAGVDRIIATINAPPGAPPSVASGAARGKGGGLDLNLLFVVLFVGVPVIGGILKRIFGRLIGSTFGAGIIGAGAWLFLGSIALGLVAAVVAFVIMLFLGAGSTFGRRGGMYIPTGGWGGGFGGGGFGGGGGGFSGGGGSFGGGGASGSW